MNTCCEPYVPANDFTVDPLFIHIPRIAGQAIKFTLGLSFCGYFTAEYTREQMTKKQWKALFKFTFVRNTYDWLWSQYVAYRTNGVRQAHRHTWEEWVKGGFDAEPTQFSRISINRQIRMDFVGRFETLHEDFEKLLGCLGVPVGRHFKLPVINRFPHIDYHEAYTDELRIIVAKRYVEDIEAFGYKF